MSGRPSCAAYVGMSPWDPPKATAIMDFSFAGGLGCGKILNLHPTDKTSLCPTRV